MPIIDRFVQFIVDFAQLFVFWVVINEYERGILLRLGIYRGNLGPGFHWIIPFSIDHVLVDNVVTRTTDLTPQSLTTKDNKTVSVRAVVTSNIRDIKKALLEVEGMDHALKDSCAAAVGDYVKGLTWEELRGDASVEILTKLCRKNAWRYGVEIERVQLADLAVSRVIRLHTSQSTLGS
jgi:regulator of protease activity HflC (stomatin/prohibitin superfamily)